MAKRNEKMERLVMYVARCCMSHQLFGRVKLNKILFFTDVNAFQRLGHTITGENYVKLQLGPVPERMDEVIETLVNGGDAHEIERSMPDGTIQVRLTPTAAGADAKTDIFTRQEKEIIDEVINFICPMSANQISELSHQSAGWREAYIGEVIPFATSLIPAQKRQLDASDLRLAEALGQRLAPGANA